MFFEVPSRNVANGQIGIVGHHVLKLLFAFYGAPLTLIADNMPFLSQLTREFACSWNFDTVTPSQEYSHSNGYIG